jgi:hypothetical protein
MLLAEKGVRGGSPCPRLELAVASEREQRFGLKVTSGWGPSGS